MLFINYYIQPTYLCAELTKQSLANCYKKHLGSTVFPDSLFYICCRQLNYKSFVFGSLKHHFVKNHIGTGLPINQKEYQGMRTLSKMSQQDCYNGAH